MRESILDVWDEIDKEMARPRAAIPPALTEPVRITPADMLDQAETIIQLLVTRGQYESELGRRWCTDCLASSRYPVGVHHKKGCLVRLGRKWLRQLREVRNA